MNILEIVNIKTSNMDISEPEKILAIDEVEQVIKNYCNIDAVPEELKFTWANMSIDLLRYNYESNLPADGGGTGDSVSVGDISSLKIGDTTINLGSGSSTNSHNRAIKSHLPNLDEIIMNNKAQLQRFRRMVW